MAKFFLGLAIAVMLAAAVLGFLAKGNIDNLQEALRKGKTDLTRSEGETKKAITEVKKKEEELAALTTKFEEQTQVLATTKTKADDLAKELDATKLVVDAKSKEVDSLNARIVALSGGPGTGTEPPEVTALKNDLAKANTERDEAKQLADTLSASVKEKEEKLAATQKEVKRYQDGFARTSLAGRILAVNPGWNFVVLSVGDRQGAAVGAMMLVTRGGDAIAKARITSVEPATSIADILPGSIRSGLTVQPGDAVVYEGPRAKAPLAPGPLPTAAQ